MRPGVHFVGEWMRRRAEKAFDGREPDTEIGLEIVSRGHDQSAAQGDVGRA